MATIFQYRIFNTSTGLNEVGWAESPPTVPFSNSTQTLDPNATVIIDRIQKSTVAVREDYKGTGGNYQTEGYSLTIPGNTTSQLSYSFPIDSVVMDITFATDTAMKGDVFNIYTPDMVVGVLTANVAAGDTVLPVNVTVVQNMFRGAMVTITDGVNTDALVLVLNVNSTDNTITLQTPLVNGYAAGTPIQMRIYFCKNLTIGPAMKFVLGGNVAGGVGLPANTVTLATYVNNSADPKTIYWYVQRLY